MEESDLPRWPSRGNRRKLDLLWLERLEREGLEPFVSDFPATPPPELEYAMAQFNRGQFWQCHETLEDLWRATPYPLRHYYHGVIKVAVGFYHVSKHNRRGAASKLSEGLRLLKVFTPEFLGLDVEGLCSEASRWLGKVKEEATPVRWRELDALARPRIHYFDIDSRRLIEGREC